MEGDTGEMYGVIVSSQSLQENLTPNLKGIVCSWLRRDKSYSSTAQR